jgi:hypothetical protein
VLSLSVSLAWGSLTCSGSAAAARPSCRSAASEPLQRVQRPSIATPGAPLPALAARQPTCRSAVFAAAARSNLPWQRRSRHLQLCLRRCCQRLFFSRARRSLTCSGRSRHLHVCRVCAAAVRGSFSRLALPDLLWPPPPACTFVCAALFNAPLNRRRARCQPTGLGRAPVCFARRRRGARVCAEIAQRL